jgi:uncharacterized repeat protein (TIGR03803 family)
MVNMRAESSKFPDALRAGSNLRRVVHLLCLLATISSVQAQTYKVLHRFTGKGDGVYPPAGVTRDSEGRIYGATNRGGSLDMGAIFEINAKGEETVLHSFWGGDGMYPDGPLIRDAAGNLYGITTQGGAPKGGNCVHGCGAVFKLDTNGKETVLYVFAGKTDGGNPSGLVFGQSGTFYGTTAYGGDLSCEDYNPGCGVVFSLDKSGKENAIFAFDRSDGTYPVGLIRDDAGNVYGTAYAGGTYNWGVVYKVDSAGRETVLYNFTGGTDGGEPWGPLIQDEAGNLYGETVFGGNLSDCGAGQYEGCGVIFKLDAAGKETVLYAFTGKADESGPAGGLIRDGMGNLYGATSAAIGGCGASCGTIFKLDTKGNETVLHTFTGGKDGAAPNGGLIMDGSGNLYGTTNQGGDSSCGWRGHGCGVVFKLTP